MPLVTTTWRCTAPSVSTLTVLPSSQLRPETESRANEKLAVAVARYAAGKVLDSLAVATVVLVVARMVSV